MIWCVEDDASIRDIELYALTSTGFEARGFDDGASFWEALQTETPESPKALFFSRSFTSSQMAAERREFSTISSSFTRFRMPWVRGPTAS